MTSTSSHGNINYYYHHHHHHHHHYYYCYTRNACTAVLDVGCCYRSRKVACVLGARVSCAKTDEPIEMSFVHCKVLGGIIGVA